jgi:DNA polymerase III delta prime subunit
MTVQQWLDKAYQAVVSLRVAVAFGFATAAAALLNAFPDFMNVPRLGPWWLVAFSVLTGGVAAMTNVAFSAPVPRPAHPRRTRRAVAHALPPKRTAPAFTQFTGRQAELHQWVNDHNVLRRKRVDQGPVVLAIHGPAGVGKSAFALELARRLADQYEDGVYAVTFGAGATSRGAADIARDLLLQLGWPDTPEDLPDSAVDRVSTLRSLTRNKAILFVFDAVRDHDQVRQVMPAETKCAVIVVSRREIGSSLGFPARSPLPRPSMHDCLEMFSAIRDSPWTRDAELAAEIVELCDRLPLAIRAAAEQARDSGDLRFVAQYLRSADTRLAALDYGGRKVAEKIESEFDRLPGPLRQAITLLAELEGESFLPWVLRPLMDLDQHVSSAFAAALEAIQLIERIDDDPTGQRRYKVNPLAWLYARANRPDLLDDAAIAAARRRLDGAYLDLIDDVLDERGDGYRRVRPAGTKPRGRTPATVIARVIAPVLDDIVRREYLNLVRVIREAPMEPYVPLIWRVAALLDGRVPLLRRSKQIEEIDSGFTRALVAAGRSGEPFAEVDVQLGHAQFLISVERYGAGLRVLGNARKALIGESPDVRRRRLRALRVEVWAYVQAARYDRAHTTLTVLDDLTAKLSPEERRTSYVLYDLELLQVLASEAHRTPFSLRARGTHSGNDIGRFRNALQESEVARRRGHWLGAERPLRLLLQRDGDARGQATALYRLARLKLDQAFDAIQTGARGSDALGETFSREAALHAAECVYMFGRIYDEIGQIRARALLMRTLVFLRSLPAAGQLRLEIAAELTRYEQDNPQDDLAFLPLQARRDRARGELEQVRGRHDAAWETLSRAAQTFRELNDWTNQASVWRVLDASP